LQALDALLHGDDVAAAPAPAAEAAPEADVTDDEFEAMLKAANQDEPEPVAEANTSDEISDDEFEALLDDLHGKGKFGAVEQSETPAEAAKPDASAGGGDMITDDEFEALLDQLHGEKGAPGANPAAPAPAEAEQAAPLAAAKPVETAPPPAAAEKPAEKKAVAKARETTPQGETSVRVDTKRLDDIMNLVGELVLVRNRLSTLQNTVENEHVSSAVSNLDVVTADLQNAVMKTRMQPIKKVFGRFPRVVRDLARSLNKEIVLEMEGEDTDLDKNLVEALADPLVHLVRNAVDHGIEMPDAREAVGKARAGKVLLKASQEGDHIELTIADDGGGMDPDKLRGIAVSKGLMDAEAAARLSDYECYNLIFAPGFSTKEEISDISGRGVGMDVVKTRIVQLNGSVEIDSKLGEGSKLIIKVPLTLAIMPTLMVVLGEQAFALPLVNVCEIFDLDLSKTNIVDGQQVVIVRDKPLPLYYLSEWLIKNRSSIDRQDSGHVVIVGVGTQRVGFVVDELLGQEEVVIKPLGKMIQGTDGLAGATITGDGNIALILDVPSLLKAYARRM
jgi:two-component system chemotaxis sensor kinase CheA